MPMIPAQAWPEHVIHLDWSVKAAKRWMVWARLSGDRYEVPAPQLAPEPEQLLETLRRLGSSAQGGERAVVLGVDAALGVPLAWADRVGVNDIVALLREAPAQRPTLFQVAQTPEQISPWRPFYPQRPGGASMRALVQGLGLQDASALRRACDQPHPELERAPCPLFWTMGANQVGKGTLSAWRELASPLLAQPWARHWPAHGELDALLREAGAGVILMETYPALYARWISAERSGSKRDRAQRASRAQATIAHAQAAPAILTQDALAALRDGFTDRPSGEDAYDAMLGALGLIELVTGRRPCPRPSAPLACVEGWIAGLSVPQDRFTP